MLTTKNVTKYYPNTIKTPKGHLNQTRKNVRSTKHELLPLEISDATSLCGKKQRGVFRKVYDVHETIYPDQTGKFLKKSQRGNKYLMVMVEIDINAILVEPLKSLKDAELTRAYHVLMMRLKNAGIVPHKHVLENEVSSAMTDVIRDKYKMEMELVPPGCNRRNTINGISSARLPSTQCRGSSDSKFQGSFSERSRGSRGRFPPHIMGPPPPTNIDHSQFAQTIKCNAHRFCARAF